MTAFIWTPQDVAEIVAIVAIAAVFVYHMTRG